MKTVYFLFFFGFWLSSFSQEASTEEPISISFLTKKLDQISKDDFDAHDADTASYKMRNFWGILKRFKNSTTGTDDEIKKQNARIDALYARSVITES